MLLLVIIVGITPLLVDSSVMSQDEEVKVAVIEVKTDNVSETTIIPGVVEPQEVIDIFIDPNMGELNEILVEEGDFIEHGTELFKYANEDIDLQKQELILERQIVVENIGHQRKIIAQIEKNIEELKSKENTEDIIRENKIQIDESQHQIRLLNIEYERINNQLAKLDEDRDALIVTSVYEGEILNINEDYLNNETEPIVTVLSSKPNIIKGVVSEYEHSHMEVNKKVTIKAKANQEQSWEGKVSSVSIMPVESTDYTNNGQSTTNYYPYTVSLNDTKDLPIGYSVYVEMEVNSMENAILVPMDSIVREHDDFYVFILGEDNILHKKKVDTGPVKEDWQVIVNGVELEDLIVENPDESLHDEKRVDVIVNVE